VTRIGVAVDGKFVDFQECFAAFAGMFHWSYDAIMKMTCSQVEYSYKALRKYSSWFPRK
jgi:hypothetical protein